MTRRPRLAPPDRQFAVVVWEDGTTTVEAVDDLIKVADAPGSTTPAQQN